jgi:signal transduction histidine kinase
LTPRKGSPFSISNWRVRWRLIAIITVPTVTALILGVIQIVGSVNNDSSFKRVQDLANLNTLVVQAAGLLANERDDTAGFVAAGGQSGAAASAALKTTVSNDQAATTTVTNQIEQQSQAVVNGSGYRSQTVLDLSNGVLANVSDLKYIRQAATSTKSPALSVIVNYDRVIQAFITFSNDVAAGTGNATLQTDVSVLNALLRMEDDASLQRAYLYQALASPTPSLTPSALEDLNQAIEQQQADTTAFKQASTVDEQQELTNEVTGPEVDEAKSAEQLAVSTADVGQTLTIGNQQTCTTDNLSASACWMTAQTEQIKDMRNVSNQLVGEITTQADSLESSSLHSAILVSVATLVLLLLVLLITTFVARSMIRPLRKLRADALEVAGSKLPEMVRRLSESEGGDASAEIEPIGVNSTDEIGEVARAFDQVHREAVRLAADEAMLRGNLNAMFVNLSRRSQSLIERQLTLIDNLEQSEQDPGRLSSLFRLDHLATRMRRNSENLLVLAGHETARRWSKPVPLVDVLRAAVSEIEQYERVVLNVQPGIQVVGQAVNDIVHLVAEIVENATTFSPEDTQVHVTGQPLTSGGVLLDITDNGVGISEQEMAHANWRLDNPPVVDVAVSRRMGLFVVGRLAARHGVRVRLRHAQSGGLTALIWLPEAVAASESSQAMDRFRDSGERSQPRPEPPSLALPSQGSGAGGFGGGPSGPGGFGQEPFGLPAGVGAGGDGPGLGGGPSFGGGPSLGGGPSGPGAGRRPDGPGAGRPDGAGGLAARMPRLAGGPSSGSGDRGGFAGISGEAAADRDYPDFGGQPSSGGSALPVRQPGTSQPGGSLGGGSLFTKSGTSAGNDVASGAPEGLMAPGGAGQPAPGPGRDPGNALPSRVPGGTGISGGGAGPGLPGRNGGGSPAGATPFATAPFADAQADPAPTTVQPAVGGNGLPAAVGGSDGSSVTVPPSVGPSQEPRLPIFDSLETDWFRRSTSPDPGSAAAAPAAPDGPGAWNSAADEGWKAARAAAEPNTDEMTNVGLPKRVPRANLVPGSVGGAAEAPQDEPLARSADSVRSRMASFQRGVREARAAGPQSEEP